MDIKATYIKSKINLPSELKELLRDEKLDEIGRIGHQLYGSGAMYGVRSISFIGKRLERAAIRGERGSIKMLIEQLDEVLSSYPSPVGGGIKGEGLSRK